MFAALILERDPLQLSKFWDGLEYWIQVAGGFAAAAVALGLIYRMIASFTPQKGRSSSRGADVAYAVVIVAYLAYAGLTSPQWLPAVKAALTSEPFSPQPPKPLMAKIENYLLTGSGLLALIVVSFGLLKEIAGFRISARRIWAVARL